MSDHAVENNPRKEMMYVGLFQLMILGIVGLIFYGGYFRPAAPSVETLLAEAAAIEAAENTAAPIDASTASPAEMVQVATADTAAPTPAAAPVATDATTANATPDPAPETNADKTADTTTATATGTPAAVPATESRDVSTAAPVLGQ